MRRNRRNPLITSVIIIILLCATALLYGIQKNPDTVRKYIHDLFGNEYLAVGDNGYFDFEIHEEQIPRYTGQMHYTVHGGIPFFFEEEISSAIIGYEYYSPLDHLGRATQAYAVVSLETFPDDDRIQMEYRPTGWVQKQYDFIDNGGWLYNRCHLISYQMTGEQENPNNLITGTRQFNTSGMLPFEIHALEYIEKYNGTCLYRVTPCYEGDNLLASGVLMECYSLESPNEATFCEFIYNVQDEVVLNYATGENNAEVK